MKKKVKIFLVTYIYIRTHFYIFVRFAGFSSPLPVADALVKETAFGNSEGEQAIGAVEK
jgi:hypothetical protein